MTWYGKIKVILFSKWLCMQYWFHDDRHQYDLVSLVDLRGGDMGVHVALKISKSNTDMGSSSEYPLSNNFMVYMYINNINNADQCIKISLFKKKIYIFTDMF